VVALQRVEMRMVRWMCSIKLKDRFPSKELRERLGIDDIPNNDNKKLPLRGNFRVDRLTQTVRILIF